MFPPHSPPSPERQSEPAKLAASPIYGWRTIYTPWRADPGCWSCCWQEWELPKEWGSSLIPLSKVVFGCFESVDGVFAGGRATTIRTSPGCPRHAHPALRSVPYYYAPPFCLQKCNRPSPSGCSTVCCHSAIFAPPCQSITSQLITETSNLKRINIQRTSVIFLLQTVGVPCQLPVPGESHREGREEEGRCR